MRTLNEKIKQLQEIIDEAHAIVFFTGAGVSTDSGIPDFRSQDGLYHLKYKYPPEGMESALETVMTQCELWTDNNDMEPVKEQSKGRVLEEYEVTPKALKAAEEPSSYLHSEK